MTWIFELSQISSQKKDTSTTKHTVAPVPKIFHFPKPGVPTLRQEVGQQEHTKGPKEKATHFCPCGCPAWDHKATHRHTQLVHVAERRHTTVWFALAGV